MGVVGLDRMHEVNVYTVYFCERGLLKLQLAIKLLHNFIDSIGSPVTYDSLTLPD